MLAQEGEGNARKVGAAARAADDHVGILAGGAQLLDGLLTDDRLMHEHVGEDRTQRVLGLAVGGGHAGLDGL